MQLLLGSDVLVSTPQAGLIEYDGRVFTATPNGVLRGILPSELFYRLDADLVGANVTTAQNTFGVGIGLAANTVYEFEAFIGFSKTVGATAHNLALLFGGTATLNYILYEFNGILTTAASAPPQNSLGGSYSTGISNSAASFNIGSAIGSASVLTWQTIKGTVSINAAGTFIPQYILSAAPGGAYSTIKGSFIKMKSLGLAGANTNYGGWA